MKKEICSFIPTFLGAILVCSEAETIGMQVVCALAGFGLWGVAWIIWQAFEAAERKRRRRRRSKKDAPAELELRPGA